MLTTLRLSLATVIFTACSALPGQINVATLPALRNAEDQASSCLTKQCVYVTNSTGGNGQGSVTIYAVGAAGNIAPLSSITGPATGLNNPQAVAVGGDHRIYVSNYSTSPSVESSITIYDAGASGNVSPAQIITGANTGLVQNYGIALIGNKQIEVSENAVAARVAVFPSNAVGDVTPIRTFGLEPKAKHPLNELFWGLSVDKSQQTFVGGINACGCGPAPNEILTYAKNDRGYPKPLQQIRGRKSGVVSPKGVGVDKLGEIYVANSPNPGQNGNVLVFAAGTSGNIRPIRTIEGKYTHLQQPNGVAFNTAQDAFVTDAAGEVLVFAPSSNGDVPPLRVIRGAQTELSGVTGLAIR